MFDTRSDLPATQLQDADSAELFTAVSRRLDQDLWFPGAHLPAKR